MAKHVEHPIIMPMSNPTSLAEAVPEDLIKWTQGKALIATGSPFDDVDYNDVIYSIGQSNNAYIFPGLGLGAIVAEATKVSKGMLAAASSAVSRLSDSSKPGASLLPSIKQLQEVSKTVAIEVAKTAIEEGIAKADITDIEKAITESMWKPEYKTIRGK